MYWRLHFNMIRIILLEVEKVFIKTFQNSQERTCVRVSFLIKLQPACNFIYKETLSQVLCYEFCEIFKGTFFYIQLLLHDEQIS